MVRHFRHHLRLVSDAMRVAISGSRGPDPARGRMNGWTDIKFIERVLTHLFSQGHTLSLGDAPSGVDSHARRVCTENEIDLEDWPVFEAHWNIEHRAAGHNRNKRMLEASDALVAIFADGPMTPGTSDAVKQAKKMGLPVYLYHEGVWDVPEPNVLMAGANQPTTLTQRLSHGTMGENKEDIS